VPASDCGDDLVWILGAVKGLRIIVGLDEEAVDGLLQRDQGVEDAALQSLRAELGEEAFDGVQP